MGAIRDFLFPKVEASMTIDAALTPIQTTPYAYTILGAPTTTTRQLAMSVPSVARARNIICGTVGSLPLEQYNKLDGAHVDPLRVINQPDPRVPGSLIYTWLAEDIWFYGVGSGQVHEMYFASDGGKVSA